jgi:hypothetical protein
MNERTESVATDLCPEWCTRATGHPYDSVDPVDSVSVRFHDSAGELLLDDEGFEIGRVYVSREQTRAPDGTVTMQAPCVVLAVDEQTLEAGSARALARALTKAADDLDRITADD